jgi:hypothetical protein
LVAARVGREDQKRQGESSSTNVGLTFVATPCGCCLHHFCLSGVPAESPVREAELRGYPFWGSWKASSSVMKRARSPARLHKGWDASRRRMAARCFWMKSATFQWSCRPSCCEFCRSGSSNGWGTCTRRRRARRNSDQSEPCRTGRREAVPNGTSIEFRFACEQDLEGIVAKAALRLLKRRHTRQRVVGVCTR